MNQKQIATIALLTQLVYGDDYGFNMDELEAIETKSYEFNGYIKGEHKYQKKKDDSFQNNYLGEGFIHYQYFLKDTTIAFDLMGNYESIDTDEATSKTLNQAYINHKFNDNNQVYVGKRSLKWGKGYYFNPIAFLDRKKDPNDPEANKEGYYLFNYKFNKVLQSDIKNIAFDLVYLKTNDTINNDLSNDTSNMLAFKSYFFYNDIDIDIAYLYSDKNRSKYGFDFSTNLQTNFEIHGEYGKSDNRYYSYLLGLKYLTDFDLTILSEYFYQNEQQTITEPLWDKKYFINSFTQKEPFDILYFTLYFKNILNMNDDSYQNKYGFLYTKIKNVEIELSFSNNNGDKKSEFGSKQIDQFTLLSLQYSF